VDEAADAPFGGAEQSLDEADVRGAVGARVDAVPVSNRGCMHDRVDSVEESGILEHRLERKRVRRSAVVDVANDRQDGRAACAELTDEVPSEKSRGPRDRDARSAHRLAR
jgi:hypothetical protein